MRKKLLSAKKLRLKLLKSLFKLWEKRPGPHQFFFLREVWKEISLKVDGRLDDPLSEGVLQSLLNEGLIEVRSDPNDKTPVVRITEAGCLYLDQHKEQLRTKKIAITGVVIGSLGLLLSMVQFIANLFKK